MPEVRDLDLLVSTPFTRLIEQFPPCSPGLDGHDWARLHFNDMVVAVRCQKCGREPLDIMSQWRVGEPDAN